MNLERSDILPCKYCGEQPSQKHHKKDDHFYQSQDYYFISCWHDEDEENFFMTDTPEQGVERWNKYQSKKSKVEVKKVEQKGQLSLF